MNFKIELVSVEKSDSKKVVDILHVEAGRFNGSLLMVEKGVDSLFWDVLYIVGIIAYRKT